MMAGQGKRFLDCRVGRSVHTRRRGTDATPAMDNLEPRCLFSHVPFILDSTQSSLALSGTVDGANISAQASGSLISTFGGTITAKLVNSSIQFLSSTVSATTQLSGIQPGQNQANFGAMATVSGATVDLALRKLGFNLTSSQTVTTDGSFVSSGESFAPVAGNIKYDETDAPFEKQPLAGTGPTANATETDSTLAISSGTMTLTIPLSGTFSIPVASLGTGATASLTFSGQFVATAPAAMGSVNSNGELVVQGTSGNNSIGLSVNGSNIDLTNYGIVTQSFPASSVTGGILVKAGGGHNSVRLGVGVQAATVHGGAGLANTIVGNTAGDLLIGGAGDDSITANGGTSTIKGGPGDDTLVVTGNDNDVLGGAGNDIIHAPSASGSGDTINGGSGDNTAYARKKFDTITNCTVIPT
jgi:RTX calcium-binding nonapeptide repeat (4 copies)